MSRARCRLCLLLICVFCVGWSSVQAVELTDIEVDAQSAEVATSPAYPKPALVEFDAADGPVNVYVIPIEDVIAKPNLYILRRGLKEAINNDVQMVVLKMDTPGGRLDVCLEMMEMLDRFEGVTATYIDVDAISAGSLIAMTTDEIYFAPGARIGSTGIITGSGEDIPETMLRKMESYMNAVVRSYNAEDPLRAKVMKAMMELDYELVIEGETLVEEGELLTLTASEAMAEYGNPPRPLLGEGIYESVDDLLEARLGAEQYVIRDFEISYSEEIAKWMNSIAPALMGLGLLLLFVEFKTPGFGLFGILGVVLIAVFFISQYIAGLAGNELIVFFVLGVLLVLVELLLFPGLLLLSIPGLMLILGSLLWAMVDYWPKGTGEIRLDMFVEPLVNLVFGMSIAVFGAILLSRLLKGSGVERSLVLAGAVGDADDAETTATSDSAAGEADVRSLVGQEGLALTQLFPSGRVEIDGQRYDARSALGMIELGATVRVVREDGFNLIVEEVSQ